ncbi:MAG: hypothetical protein J7L63_03905 [Thermoplasmata archaeon]|nr:hypothetical protein [Thermoplasmata archaeon]
MREAHVVGDRFKEKLEREILSQLSEDGEIHFQPDSLTEATALSNNLHVFHQWGP